MVDEKQAVAIAVEFVQRETGQTLKCYGAVFIDGKEQRRRIEHLIAESPADRAADIEIDDRNWWSVSFEVRTASGSIMDGPLHVDVDAEFGIPRFFDSP
jgi:hypothetical protein